MAAQKERSNRPLSRKSVAHIPHKDNATVDISALTVGRDVQASKKKQRGKSLGPGGLEALTETDANVLKAVSPLRPKSILKPTVPLTPPKHIPTFDELRKRSTTKAKSPAKSVAEDLLIDFSTPAPNRDETRNNSNSRISNILDPFSPIALPKSHPHETEPVVENGSNAPARMDDDEAQRQARKKVILDQRAARRKSMANRRVSFAPEATLHTWSVMELMEDSTTSSVSNSTRRQSSMTAAQSPMPVIHSGPNSDQIEPPSTPPEQVEEPLVQASPARQRDLHQKKRRRSSAMSETSDASGDEIFSSPDGDSALESSPIRVEESIDSESDTDGDTAMSLDEQTVTASRSEESNGTSTRTTLDDRLRQAAQQAGTRGITYDEHGSDDESMELADGTVTHAFKQYSRQPKPSEAADDQENLPPADLHSDDMTEGITMEMTRAVGGIVPGRATYETQGSTSHVQRSTRSVRQSLGADSSCGDETMDLTVAKGGIVANYPTLPDEDDQADESEDEITMEFTKALGSVRPETGKPESTQSLNTEETESMDMTVAAGGILATIEERTEPHVHTQPQQSPVLEPVNSPDIQEPAATISTRKSPRAATSKGSRSQTTTPTRAGQESSSASKTESALSRQFDTIASETGSPSLKPRLSGRRTTANSITTTPKSAPPARPTPRTSTVAEQTTPTKQLTTQLLRAATPERTPVAANIAYRGASPKKLFSSESKSRTSPFSARKSPAKKHDPLFSRDDDTGRHTPRVVLHAQKPHQHLRRSSKGAGLDREGIGSPRVSDILDRRVSIGDSAPHFKLGVPKDENVRFEDPKQMEMKIDAERAEEHRRESGRFVMEQEADERQEENATLQLKEMIESITPKRTRPGRLRGRKSLAVGAAKGLLGKRPAELDVDESEDGDSTPKRLKVVSREGSPIKQVHLPRPPSKEETTARLTRAEQRQLAIVAGSANTPSHSPSPEPQAQSPSHVGRFKETSLHGSPRRQSSFEDRLDNVIGAVDVSTTHPAAMKTPEENISLQQFLNMTNIHFIELSTTKRRHTTIQAPSRLSAEAEDRSSETCFVAAATTMPLLELYQHATKELKSYISTGRRIVRSIEAETLAEQPALFREYVEAKPDIKLIMDNQFRNGKTNARLQSKEGWYTWRAQLVGGLQCGLESIKADLDNDLRQLQEQQLTLDQAVPVLASTKADLKEEADVLQRKIIDLDGVDREALRLKRREVKAATRGVRQKTSLLKELKGQLQEKEELLSSASELKSELQDQIEEADRVRAEHRGWQSRDVVQLKHKVDTIKQDFGWTLLAAEEDFDEPSDHGVAVTLMYKDQLKLFFHPSAFAAQGSAARRRSGRSSRSTSGPNAPISLTYSPVCEDSDDDGPTNRREFCTAQRFLLQILRGQIHAFSMMSRGSVSTKTVLNTVSAGWDLSFKILQEIRLLEMAGMTSVSIKGDERLAVKVMLVQNDKSRIDVEFTLLVTGPEDGETSATTSVSATAVYGPVLAIMDSSKTKKIQTALTKEIESQTFGDGAWSIALQGFQEWLLSQLRPRAESERPTPAATTTRPDTRPTGQSSPARPQLPPPAEANSSNSAIRRSPLAPKSTNKLQKKALPVPTQRAEKLQLFQPVNRDKSHIPQGKENSAPPKHITANTASSNTTFTVNRTEPTNALVKTITVAQDDVFENFNKPAITPEMQEAMMHTPVKRRVGALRRSPI